MEGRGLDAVAHLALLGLKTQDPAFWGTYENKSTGFLRFEEKQHENAAFSIVTRRNNEFF